MKLIIAEKPSAARAICAAVGANEKKNGCYEGGGYVVSWCLGHLVTLAPPKAYDERYETWTISDLPIAPDEFKTVVIGDRRSKEQFEVLRGLIGRDDVSEIVNAADSDREGELIFRLVYEKIGCRKPVRRMWTSSLEEGAIVAALERAKEGSDYDALALSAKGRQRADWLVGMNLTRLYTKMYGSVLKCGRVQTPTVCEVVRRQLAIDGFVPTPYYRLVADFGEFRASCRVDRASDAERISRAACGAEGLVLSVEDEEKTVSAPRLYSLTELQRAADRAFGMSAKRTLDAAQGLYERGLATYPRTDSRYITQDMSDSVADAIAAALAAAVVDGAEGMTQGDFSLSAIVKDSRVESHPAIVPTAAAAKSDLSGLTEDEREILGMLFRRLFAACMRPYRYVSRAIEIGLAGETFVARGRTSLEDGWRAIEKAAQKSAQGDDAVEDCQELPRASRGGKVACHACDVEERTTNPPSQYTQDTLLKFMATAGKKDAGDDAVEAMTDEKGTWRGIGTSATRAGIIESVIESGYIVQNGRAMAPTRLAFALYEAVPDDLRDPTMTAQWEIALAEIQRGERRLEDFLSEVSGFVERTVKSASPSVKASQLIGSIDAVCECPRCGGAVVEKGRTYSCASNSYSKNDAGKWALTSGCGFAFWSTVAGRKIPRSAAKSLCESGITGKIKGFVSKAGRQFDARLKLEGAKEGVPEIRFVFDDRKGFRGRPGAARRR